MKSLISFGPSVLLLAFALIVPRAARAQDSGDGSLPQLPAEKADANSSPARGTVKTDTPVVAAGTVRTNHVDTVVVAEPGSTVTVHGADSKRPQREYAPDPARKAAIIAAPIVFGVGAATAGIAYLVTKGQQSCSFSSSGNGYEDTCTTNDATPSLVLYDVIVGAVPSTPRWVVGDVTGALIYTGIRGASLATASLVSWGNGSQSWIGPFTFAFLIPVTLGIVDLATTPHREDLQPPPTQPAPDQAALGFRPRITGLTPIATTDAEHRVNGGILSLGATF
jgi:hypothetical protein